MATTSLLDTLDTTVTLEWESTRTIGTLIELGRRRIIVTALRAPPIGMAVYLRVETDGNATDAIAIDGNCAIVVDSEWGEQQVEVIMHRVGTTTSAAALRDFIESHGIERGGTVSVGRNRENPDLKRFVYSLPDVSDVTASSESEAKAQAAFTPTSMSAVSSPPVVTATQPVVAATQAVASGYQQVRASQPVSAPNAVSAPAAVKAPSFIPPLGASGSSTKQSDPPPSASTLRPPAFDMTMMGQAVQTSPAPQPASTLAQSQVSHSQTFNRMAQPADQEFGQAMTPAMSDGFAFSADELLSALEDAASSAVGKRGSGSNQAHGQQVETTRRYASGPVSEPVRQDPNATLELQLPYGKEDHDDSEEIVVATVDHGIQQAAPINVKGADKAGFMQRLLGRKDDSRDAETSKRAPRAQPVLGATAAQLFVGDFAHRMDMPVQFEAGPRKKKAKGVLLRLAESKLRVRSADLPALYERITVFVIGRAGPKDVISVRCEVMRISEGDGDPTNAIFDARISPGGNPPTVMTKLRELMQGAAPVAEQP
ncbi:MAG: hypothetical protein EXR77_07990 [Myxococcales bacterium]|nr:hypothetical protein [Myxococcales bacterium]